MTQSAKVGSREKVRTDPPFNREEVDMRLRSIQDLYLTNAKSYLENVEKMKDLAESKGFDVHTDVREWVKEQLASE